LSQKHQIVSTETKYCLCLFVTASHSHPFPTFVSTSGDYLRLLGSTLNACSEPYSKILD